MRCLRRISGAVDRGLTNFYRALGRFIARRPWLVIFICAAVTAVCCVGFLRFKVEDDAEKLYTPQNAPSFEDKEYVDANYPSDSLSVKVLSLDRAQSGGSVLTKEALLEHLRAYNLIISQVVIVDGKSYSWRDVCDTGSINNTKCRVDSILQLWEFNEATLRADPDVVRTINSGKILDWQGLPLSLSWVMGGVERDATGAVTRAEVFQTVFYIRVIDDAGNKVDGEGEGSVAFTWQERITKVAYEDWSSSVLAQYVSCSGAVGKESTNAINRDIGKLSIGYILLIIYTIMALWRNSWAYQKAHVAFGSFLAIGMGIAMDFGMLSGFGLKFNFVCQVLPFLLVGVGVDNTFVIISNYFDQDPDAPIEYRMGEALGLAGSSITVSCMTNVIAFAVGTYTSLEALLSFSVYASIGTLLVFLFQVTAFPAFLTLDARRELRTRLGVGCPGFGCVAPGCCAAEPVEEQLKQGNNGWSPETNTYKHESAGPTITTSFSTQATSALGDPSTTSATTATTAAKPPPQPLTPNGQADSGAVGSVPDLVKVMVRTSSPSEQQQQQKEAVPPRDFTTPVIVPCFGGRIFDPHADQLSTKIVARWLPALSLNNYGKIVVVLLECVMLGFAIYGCTKVYMDFNFRELFVPQSNWLHKAFQVEDKYFGGEKVPVAVYTRATRDGRDYFYYQDQLLRVSEAFKNDKYITNVPAVSSWYVNYQAWLNRTYAPLLYNGRAPNETAFNAWLQEWLRTDGRGFSDDVLMNTTTGRIAGSRINGFTKDVVDGSWAVKCVDSTRDTAEFAAPGLDPIAFGPSYTFWDGFRSIAFSTVTNVIIAGAAVFLVTMILLADVVASLIVGTMVVLSDVGVFGFMHYANLQFNSVTCIVLVLAVGIAVDYSAHVMRAFLVSTGTRQERAHKALIEIGGAVWNGAMTTFLAVLPMAFAEHYIFTTIFKMFSVLILLSIWHGIVLLPVIMSWIGPLSYRDADQQSGDAGEVGGDGKDKRTAVQPV
ncbi:hypothetical protein Vretimale_6063 [Volvox reticuliferus]|uniref:SSD domain-containing protein n=1 Tax=Volvox reticuliferus TaxID=1737510 RepID=A0A8J4LL95_9CHLO|nr:hypothetical protein Vretifemale_20825 [Volvox reticuliferus]GIM01263.1 hypothetical protein Vretimale_6063 [Volvox reticuliferus]